MEVPFFEQIICGNEVTDYFLSVSTFLFLLIVLISFKKYALPKLQTFAKSTRTTVDNFLVKLLEKIGFPLYILAAFFLSIQFLALHVTVQKTLRVIGIIAVVILSANCLTYVINYGFDAYFFKKSGSRITTRNLKSILRIFKIIVWCLAVVFALDNLGLEISAVIAGLGIGGIAIGLAAQTILKDLFSHLAIILDQPFEIGDFIIVDDLMGVVEHIGIKTTRLRSLGGEQLVFSNTDLTDSRVRNYKRMERRRVLFTVNVVYQTPTHLLQEIPTMIEKIIKGIDDTEFDRAHFCKFGDFSLIIEVVFYVIGNDYNKYMEIMQYINFAIKREFEQRSISFAYPTQSIILEKALPDSDGMIKKNPLPKTSIG
ncbi:MAG: mechanosensitive ion channel [bacterium]|nr:mechanosensitive ion channel [bacterium]